MVLHILEIICDYIFNIILFNKFLICIYYCFLEMSWCISVNRKAKCWKTYQWSYPTVMGFFSFLKIVSISVGYIEYLCQVCPNVMEKKCNKRKCLISKSQKPHTIIIQSIKCMRIFLTYIKQRILVASFSKFNAISLMWANYCNNKEGFVLGYLIDDLSKAKVPLLRSIILMKNSI